MVFVFGESNVINDYIFSPSNKLQRQKDPVVVLFDKYSLENNGIQFRYNGIILKNYRTGFLKWRR